MPVKAIRVHARVIEYQAGCTLHHYSDPAAKLLTSSCLKCVAWLAHGEYSHRQEMRHDCCN